MNIIMNSQAFHQGGEIYIRTDTPQGFFNAITTATDPGLRSDFLHIASGIVAHEQYHKLNPTDFREGPAYMRERDVFGKFKNYFNTSSVYEKQLKEINDAINKYP